MTEKPARLDAGTVGKKGPVKLSKVPHGIAAIITRYGDPEDPETGGLDPEYIDKYTTLISLPFPLRLSWKPERLIHSIRCHKLIARPLLAAFLELDDGIGAEYLERNRFNYFGGCFNYRKMVGHDVLSTHSWGIAVDLNPHKAGYGARPTTQLPAIVQAFKRRGFDWGGDWPPKWKSDPMHLQACTGY